MDTDATIAAGRAGTPAGVPAGTPAETPAGTPAETQSGTQSGTLAASPAGTLTASLSKLAQSSLVRFVVVGGLSFATDFGTLFLTHGLLGVWLPLATVLSFGVAFVVNFGLNRMWAFRASGSVGQQLRRYLYLVAVNLVLTVLLVQGLVWLGLVYLLAKACSTAVLTIGNYFISRKWIFL